MKKITRFCLMFLVGFICLLPTQALNVIKPTDKFYINDAAGVISQDVENHIVNYNDVLYDKTGAQFVVVVVDFFNGADIKDYAYALFNQWGIGTKNNGVLLLLGIGEDDYYCMTGSAISKFMNDARIDDLLYDYLEEDFAAGNYSDGVLKVFNAMYEELENHYGFSYHQVDTPSQTTKKSTNNSLGIILGMIVVVLIIAFIFSRPRREVIVVDGRPRRRWVFFGPRRYRYRPYYRRRYRAPRPSRQQRAKTTPTPPRAKPTVMPTHSTSTPVSRPRTGGGGSSRGGGAGRSTSTRTSSSSSRSSSVGRSVARSRPSSTPRSGGGGSTRGGGSGRRK